MSVSFSFPHKAKHILGLIFALSIVYAFVIFPGIQQKSTSALEKIQQLGYLRILTLNSASTYYQDNTGDTGFEYQLAKWFCESIGVESKFFTVSRFSDLYPELLFGTGDIAAAGLSKDESALGPSVIYGPQYYEVSNQILYHKELQERPDSIADLSKGSLQVISGTSQAQLLQELQRENPDLFWTEVDDIAIEELIEKVNIGEIDYILADSHNIALQRRFYPELRVAFELGQPRQLRWAFNHAGDDSLEQAISRFFKQIESDGRLEQLVHRHYSHVAKFNYSDTQTFNQLIRDRLPKYQTLFENEAKVTGLDWRFLAAIGYQESLWDERAKSPTGVRGLMMLTQATAKQVKVKNRLDPVQSIRGGARYFTSVLKRFPQSITEPDRTWLALASYNVGYGHVEDARKITIDNGGDPDKWIDVKKSLPLLARKKWYKKTKYGYARGWEPVKYVENIRKYYEFLVGSDIKANKEVIETGTTLDSVQLTPNF